jgi:hypothetical protein
MSTRFTIPAYTFVEPDEPQPVVWRHVTIIEGLDADGASWLNIVYPGGADADMRSLLAEAARTFPTQRTAESDR